MSPSSPVSVGTFLSNRTLLFGVVQVLLVLEGIKFEHLPVLDDPFTATKSVSKGKKYSAGKTEIITLLHTLLNTVLPCELVSGKN